MLPKKIMNDFFLLLFLVMSLSRLADRVSVSMVFSINFLLIRLRLVVSFFCSLSQNWLRWQEETEKTCKNLFSFYFDDCLRFESNNFFIGPIIGKIKYLAIIISVYNIYWIYIYIYISIYFNSNCSESKTSFNKLKKKTEQAREPAIWYFDIDYAADVSVWFFQSKSFYTQLMGSYN